MNTPAMHRFYCPKSDLRSSMIKLTNADEMHHLKNVLRLKKGACISLFDGKGGEAEGDILAITREHIHIQIHDRSFHSQKKIPIVTLACAIPKKAKFETIIEKCTELNVDEIVPLLTHRTDVKLSPQQMNRKTSRYHTVAVNAAKQSERTTVPAIHPPTPFKKFIVQTDPAAKFIGCIEGRRKNLSEALTALKYHQKLTFLIGPEGDFSPAEIQSALDAGYQPITLGPTVLKVDTAAITVIAAANLHLSRQQV